MFMSASEVLDAIATSPGSAGGPSGASQAPTQTGLKGEGTWMELPIDNGLPAWKGVRPLVTKFRLPLSGRPLSGVY